jgi:hypothetical protein
VALRSPQERAAGHSRRTSTTTAFSGNAPARDAGTSGDASLHRLGPCCLVAASRSGGKPPNTYSRSSSRARPNIHSATKIATRPPAKPAAAPHSPAVVPPIIPPTAAPMAVSKSGRRHPIICIVNLPERCHALLFLMPNCIRMHKKGLITTRPRSTIPPLRPRPAINIAAATTLVPHDVGRVEDGPSNTYHARA